MFVTNSVRQLETREIKNVRIIVPYKFQHK